MQEDWLRDGQFHHLVYSLHLTSWLLIAMAVLIHATAALHRGGLALVASMARFEVRANDGPRHWPAQLLGAWRRRG